MVYSARRERLSKPLLDTFTRQGGVQVEIEFAILNGKFPIECGLSGCHECVCNCRVDVLKRPDDIIYDDGLFVVEVGNKATGGAEFLYTLKLPSGQSTPSLIPSHRNHAIGKKIGIRLAVDHLFPFRRE